ncbi:hypothetical protein CJ030_MR1G013791 [Morella rubra]|uniref:Uncharacterized protein n=1 Tax=Morella rubra TaxID=262757 RepID=A0A6A1WRI7_9ROSI|nr:hypothetical protein CJ030_MR1G013791 [Morella rubra]
MARYYNNSFFDNLYFPVHLWFFLGIVFFILGFTWYLNFESMFEDFFTYLKLFCIIVPVLLLIIVHCLSSGVPSLIPSVERDSLLRAGGSPWGVALVLVFLLFVISYQSTFHERWFPLRSK